MQVDEYMIQYVQIDESTSPPPKARYAHVLRFTRHIPKSGLFVIQTQGRDYSPKPTGPQLCGCFYEGLGTKN